MPRGLFYRDAARQAVGTRLHTHDVAALEKAFERSGALHLLEACYRASLHVEHVDVHPFGTADVEHAAFKSD